MVDVSKCIDFINEYLQIDKFQDYCPNGLQVSGKSNIKKIVSGVSACQKLFEQAVDANADLIIVHHGLYWHKQSPCAVGIMKQRLTSLFQHNMNLAAYHLPLDAHDVVGNNVQLADMLDAKVIGSLSGRKPAIGIVASLPEPVSAQILQKKLTISLDREAEHFPGDARSIQKVAICSGAAQHDFLSAIDLSVDAYITGEVSEFVPHLAHESGVHFFAAGHHATECHGIQALGALLVEQFGVKHDFINIYNSV